MVFQKKNLSPRKENQWCRRIETAIAAIRSGIKWRSKIIQNWLDGFNIQPFAQNAAVVPMLYIIIAAFVGVWKLILRIARTLVEITVARNEY